MILDYQGDLKDENATLNFAKKLANHLCPGMTIYFKGELGVGKTTWVRGLLRELGFKDKVKSPTYTLVEPYHFDKFTIYHFDLYRFKDENEWNEAGFREYFNQSSICFVEWPEKAGQILPKPDIEIELSHQSLGRHIHMTAYSKLGEACLKTVI